MPQTINVFTDDSPEYARIIVPAGWAGKNVEVKEVMKGVADNWPADFRANALVTCAGFLKMQWPVDGALSLKNIIDGNGVDEDYENFWRSMRDQVEAQVIRAIPQRLAENLVVDKGCDLLAIGISTSLPHLHFSMDLIACLNGALELECTFSILANKESAVETVHDTAAEDHLLYNMVGKRSVPLQALFPAPDVAILRADFDPSHHGKVVKQTVRSLLNKMQKHQLKTILGTMATLNDAASLIEDDEVLKKYPYVKEIVAAGRLPRNGMPDSDLRSLLKRSKTVETTDFVVLK